MAIYSSLMNQQILGLLPLLAKEDLYINFVIFVFLFALTSGLRYFRLSIHATGIGVVNAMAVILFFIWAVATTEKG